MRRSLPSALFIFVLVSAALVSCAPKDSAVKGKKGDDPNVMPMAIEAKPFAKKSPELTLLALRQLAHANRYMNLALDFKLSERSQTKGPKDLLGLGSCRTLAKISPSFSREFDTSTEVLRVDYLKCAPETVAATQTTLASISGSEAVTIVYDKPYPRQNAVETAIGFPQFIGVQTSPLIVRLPLKSGAIVTVSREVRLSASRINESDTTLTYWVSNDVTDSFTQENQSVIVRRGTVAVSLSGFKMTVAKAEGHALQAIADGEVRVAVNGQKMRSDAGSGQKSAKKGSDMEPFSLDMTLAIAEGIQVPDSICKAFPGSYTVKSSALGADPVPVTVGADAQVTIGSAISGAAQVCSDPLEVDYLAEFEDVYL